MRVGDTQKGATRVLNAHEERACAQIGAGHRTADDDTGGPFGENLREEIVPIEVLTAQRDETIARPHFTAVDHDPTRLQSPSQDPARARS